MNNATYNYLESFYEKMREIEKLPESKKVEQLYKYTILNIGLMQSLEDQVNELKDLILQLYNNKLV